MNPNHPLLPPPPPPPPAALRGEGNVQGAVVGWLGVVVVRMMTTRNLWLVAGF